ncbi:hypothetical protein KTT_02540 [Tengunoibacter tsumagoiensis]|uniref:Uncharacterized protein n=1 Tax=Tengunoibacter tsumagoiensis TaxID=2014871 RepID=A0A401ZU21_9CHLR|nr:hypothetical protein KTT_02540 [Tengunoibacter tsumagoiensis]
MVAPITFFPVFPLPISHGGAHRAEWGSEERGALPGMARDSAKMYIASTSHYQLDTMGLKFYTGLAITLCRSALVTIDTAFNKE